MCLMFCIQCYDVCYGFHMDTMFGLSLPSAVCRRDHVLFTYVVCVCLHVTESGSCWVVSMLCISLSCVPCVANLSGLPIFDFPFCVLWRLFFVYSGYLYSLVCLWIENKHSMSIVYRESFASSEWSNGMTYLFMYTHIINWSPDRDFIRLNKGKITQA